MTDKEYREVKRKIKKLMKKWLTPLGLRWWRFTLNYIRDRSPERTTDYAPKSINEIWVAAFTTCCDPWYRTAIIDCFIPTLKDLPEDELEDYFVHELMHIIMSPMHTKQKAKEEEMVATNLALAFTFIKNKK